MIFDDLLDGESWIPMSPDQQHFPAYFWQDGRPLSEAPIDFRATFDGKMFMSKKPIEIPKFNRNPLRVVPHFTVPRHHHNLDETIFVLAGEYSIDHGEGDDRTTTVVRPGDVFTSRAGTPYTMTAGPEGVTYIETWNGGIRELETTWHDVGWVHLDEHDR